MVYNTNNSDLPDDNIISIEIDNSGNKWVGTKYGLVKFDDSVWTVYSKSNSGMPDDYVNSLVAYI